jgi:hypothetical protein
MNREERAFLSRPEGRPFLALLERPELAAIFEKLSFLEIPAVQGVVPEIDELLERLAPETREAAIQATDASIEGILARRGYRIVRDENGDERRGPVRKSRFLTTGLLWESVGRQPDKVLTEGMRIAEKAMQTYRTALAELAK